MSLRVLGLEPGASASDVRRAFRKLARTCHPDVVGRGGTLRFQKIAGAYTLLKGLAPEELRDLPMRMRDSRIVQHTARDTNRKGARAREQESGRSSQGGGFFRWRRHSQGSSGDGPQTQDTTANRECEARATREVKEREARKREEQARRCEQLNRVIDQYDENISRCLERLEHNADESHVKDIIVRLGSSIPAVRQLALSRVGTLVNRKDVRQALIAMLRGRNVSFDGDNNSETFTGDAVTGETAVSNGQRGEIDECTARLVAALPMRPEVRRRIASDVASNASAFPDFLISSLLNLRDPNPSMAPDPSLLERYLVSAAPSGVVLVLYRWPTGETPTMALLERLLEKSDSRILVSLFAAMKQKFPQVIPRLRTQFERLLDHPEPMVRVWARVFLKNS